MLTQATRWSRCQSRACRRRRPRRLKNLTAYFFRWACCFSASSISSRACRSPRPALQPPPRSPPALPSTRSSGSGWPSSTTASAAAAASVAGFGCSGFSASPGLLLVLLVPHCAVGCDSSREPRIDLGLGQYPPEILDRAHRLLVVADAEDFVELRPEPDLNAPVSA